MYKIIQIYKCIKVFTHQTPVRTVFEILTHMIISLACMKYFVVWWTHRDWIIPVNTKQCPWLTAVHVCAGLIYLSICARGLNTAVECNKWNKGWKEEADMSRWNVIHFINVVLTSWRYVKTRISFDWFIPRNGRAVILHEIFIHFRAPACSLARSLAHSTVCERIDLYPLAGCRYKASYSYADTTMHD